MMTSLSARTTTTSTMLNFLSGETNMRTLILLASIGALFWSIDVAVGADKVSEVFLRDAIQSNLAEIRLAQLAQEKGQGVEVKSYAERLVADNSTSNEQASKVAAEIGITVPTETNTRQKAIYDTMSKLSGAALERAFIKEMIADHKMNIARFENEAKKMNDPVANFALQMLPILQRHLDAARKLQSGTL